MASDTAPATLITQAMREQLNVWSVPRVSHPIDASDMRRWAIAVYWPETPPRIFWDEAYAKTTRFRGIIAPREFNPFAWPAERPADMAPKPAKRSAGERSLNGRHTETYGVPMRVGDVITAMSALVRLDDRGGQS